MFVFTQKENTNEIYITCDRKVGVDRLFFRQRNCVNRTSHRIYTLNKAEIEKRPCFNTFIALFAYWRFLVFKSGSRAAVIMVVLFIRIRHFLSLINNNMFIKLNIILIWNENVLISTGKVRATKIPLYHFTTYAWI